MRRSRYHRGNAIRLAACGVVAVGLALPATATAAPHDYSGNVRGLASAHTDFTLRGGGAQRRVQPFEFDNLPISCPGGRTDDFRLDGPYRVNGEGRFGGRELIHQEGYVVAVTVRGQLRRRGTAVGTVRAVLMNGVRRCDTGTLGWVARRLR